VALPGWYVTQTGCGDVLVFKGKRTDVARPNVRGTRMSSVMIQRICPAESKDYLISQLAGLEHEVFARLFLDYRHRVIEFRQLFGRWLLGTPARGSQDGPALECRRRGLCPQSPEWCT
jgi:hypothetical protein